MNPYIYAYTFDKLPWWGMLIIILVGLAILMIIPSNFISKRKKRNNSDTPKKEKVEKIEALITDRASDFEKNKPVPKKEKLLLGMYNGVGHKTAIRIKSLVYVYPEKDSCELCRPFEGKIISLEKYDNEFVTMKEAISKGYHHIGCKHLDVDYYPGETEIPEKPWSEKEQIQFHKTVLKMFKLENEIRILDFNIANGVSTNVESDREKLTILKNDLITYCEKNNLTYTDRRLNPSQNEIGKYQYLPIENEE